MSKLYKSILFLLVFTVMGVGFPAQAAAHHGTAPVVWFSPGQGGFYHARYARPRQSIRMGTIPTANIGFSSGTLANAWNREAGWGLFRVTNTNPQVIFKPDMRLDHPRDAWVERVLYPNKYMYKCIVHYKYNAIGVNKYMNAHAMAHEVGHCLGFRDHVFWYPAILTGQPQCNRPDRPYYSRYKGTMSYCSWAGKPATFWTTYDRASLYHYGYGLRRY